MHRPIHWLEISMLIRASERALFEEDEEEDEFIWLHM